ncbi:MAG: mechanosensitive ion channel domain-containing protein [Polyangiales bacterium]
MVVFRILGLVTLLLGSIASSAAAQLIDPPSSESSAQEERAEGAAEVDGPPPQAQRWFAKPSRTPAALAEPLPVGGRSPLLTLFLSLLGVGVALFITERARSWLTNSIPLGRLLGVLVFVLRLVGLSLLLAIVLQSVPGGKDWILLALVVLALVIGWSVRDLFADLVAGGVLAAERRVKKGMWVSGDGFQGTVEGRSLRATWLRDGQGHRLTVPNRAMVGAPMVYDAGAEAEHEVVVRLQGYHDASKVRLALTDAILSSPWVLAGATPVVLRDPADPVVWRVRTRLLEPRFSLHFEGELLERVEDLLRYEPEPEERETVPGTATDS